MEYKVKITVFTPVYNRGYCIKNVYDSLVKQSFRDFEWLVINDGSTDNTDEVIKECIDENKINIRYFIKNNGGQHRALNDAIQTALGELLMIVDSDDDLTEDALEWIVFYEKNISIKKGFAGVSGLRCHRDGRIIGLQWPDKSKKYIDLTNIERYKKKMLLGDKAEAYYDVEKGVLWNRIAKAGFKIRWFNRAIYNCEYLNDGMSKNIYSHYFRNFNGYSFYIMEFLQCDIGFLRKIKTAIVYCELARKKRCKIREISSRLKFSFGFSAFVYIMSFISPFRFVLRRKRL